MTGGSQRRVVDSIGRVVDPELEGVPEDKGEGGAAEVDRGDGRRQEVQVDKDGLREVQVCCFQGEINLMTKLSSNE